MPSKFGSTRLMTVAALIRSRVKAARKRGAHWVELVDVLRLLWTGQGRSVLWTRMLHGREVHQTTSQTAEDRYPELFDLLAQLAPAAQRILSFGCSTGEELVAIRHRFLVAEIVGAEINPRSRRIAARRTAGDSLITVVPPDGIAGSFDLLFALAVLQREPHKIAEMQIDDLSPHYSFERFDAAVRELVARLRTGGLLCVENAHYRIEDSSAVAELEPVRGSPAMTGLLFGPDGRRLSGVTAQTIFRKR
jgi:SAM-dependent methyltransferase